MTTFNDVHLILLLLINAFGGPETVSIEGVAPPGGYINDEVFKLSLPHTVKPTRNMRVVILRWGMTDCLLYTDGKTFWVEADRRRALQIMLLGYAILLDAIEINNGDMALASLHIGRQMDAIVRMLARVGLDIRMLAGEKAFMDKLFSDKNLAWMSRVLSEIAPFLKVKRV